MDISELGRLMVEHGACLRAIPNRARSVVEVQHADQYPTGKIVFLPEYDREMLVVESVPAHAGRFLVETCIGTSSTVHFSNEKFYSTLEEAVSVIRYGRYPELSMYDEENHRLDLTRDDPELYGPVYEVVFDVEGARYYCYLHGTESLLEALGLFFQDNPNITYDMIVEHTEV